MPFSLSLSSRVSNRWGSLHLGSCAGRCIPCHSHRLGRHHQPKAKVLSRARRGTTWPSFSHWERLRVERHWSVIGWFPANLRGVVRRRKSCRLNIRQHIDAVKQRGTAPKLCSKSVPGAGWRGLQRPTIHVREQCWRHFRSKQQQQRKRERPATDKNFTRHAFASSFVDETAFSWTAYAATNIRGRHNQTRFAISQKGF